MREKVITFGEIQHYYGRNPPTNSSDSSTGFRTAELRFVPAAASHEFLDGIHRIRLSAARVEYRRFCICLRGKSRVTLNQHRCYIQKGDLCVFFPRMLMQLDDHSDDFEAYCIVSEIDVTREVQVPSATSLFLYIKDHPCISLDDTTFRRMLKYCRMFSEFERNGHPYRDQITLHMSMMLYYEIFHIYQHGKPLAMSAQTRQESMFREFLFLVSQHYVREREIGYYADQICVTPKYLSSVVRTVSGNSAAWWINQTVIMHAKNLLKTNHQLTIQQISDKLNFPNPSFFGQYFKRRVGMTPKEFRRKAY